MSGRKTSRRAPAAAKDRTGFAWAALGGAALDLLVRAARSPGVQRAVALAGLTAGVAAASDVARARVEANPRFQLDRAALSVAPLPACLSRRARQDLERLPLPARPHAFDPSLVPVTAACLAALPWVREVERVRLDARGRLEFSLLARVPVARLGADVALTSDGTVVPLAYAASAAALPAIEGLPPDGGAERAKALVAAVAVLEDLGDLRPRVRTIDLSNLGGHLDAKKTEVLLTLDSGLVVEWGRAPDEPGTLGRPRLDGEAQRRALRGFLGSPHDPAAIERVSVRWDQVVYVLRPAATATPPAPQVAARR